MQKTLAGGILSKWSTTKTNEVDVLVTSVNIRSALGKAKKLTGKCYKCGVRGHNASKCKNKDQKKSA